MKKFISTIKKALPIGMALALLLPLFACKKGDAPAATPEPTAIVTEQPTAAPTEAPEPTLDPEAQKQAKIEERVANYCSIMKATLAELNRQLEASGMSVEALAEGKDLVFKYTLLSSLADGMSASGLRESLDLEGAALVQTYNALAAFAGDDSVRFIIRYVDSKGKTLINYIIDKNYEPIDSSAALDPRGYASLSEFIESGFFQSFLERAGDMSEFDVTATVENETMLVINYTATRSFNESEIEQIRSDMEKTFEVYGTELSDLILGQIKLLVSSVNADELKLVFRYYTEDGSLITEFRADHLPSDV
ncbi:MAG: DUF4854 domain-containing protein [Clostridia bacterium]|nr:DUF4854 domain-containing protein [Clostridia bacterium]